jgi:hypothetical protein
MLPMQASADWWSENFEVHGFLSTKAYFVSPNLDVENEMRLNSWRTELNLEAELSLIRARKFSVSLYGILRPIYEGIHDVDPEHYGKSVSNTPSGLMQDGGLDFFCGENCRRSAKGQPIPGAGDARIPGLWTPLNNDLITDITGVRYPAVSIDQTVVYGNIPAPIRARGSKMPKVGGSAKPATYIPLQQNFGSGNLGQTLNLAAASGVLFKPLSAHGDRQSLERAPVDFNRTEDQLKFECGDNAHPWCFVRELYAEIEFGDTLVRLGKQQVVWGKTDVFRMQDIVNPLDLGIHNVVPPLEEGTIPQLALDVIHSFGDVGPFQDFSVEFVWNFDRFLPIQLGQCGEPYALSFACEARADAMGHSLINVALAGVEERHWKLDNTEVGLRLEFRTRKPSIAWSLSGYWGFQDLPAVENANLYSVDNPNLAAMMATQGLLPELVSRVSGTTPTGVENALNAADVGFMDPLNCEFGIVNCGFNVTDPASIVRANENGLELYETLFLGAAVGPDCPAPVSSFGPECFPVGVNFLGLTFPAEAIQALAAPWSMSEAVIRYPRVFTLGGSLDYQIPRTDTILRAETSFEVDRVLINTAKPDWQDASNVVKAALGFDRFTFIRPLNRNRAAFVSIQTFVEHILDYDDGSGSNDGMVQDKTAWISTFFMQNYWRNDSLILTSIFAYDWNARAWLAIPSFRWIINESWFVDIGVNVLGGKRETHTLVDLCKNATTDCLSTPREWRPGTWQATNAGLVRSSETGFGWVRESFGDRFAERRDEVWIGLTYQF